MGLLQLAQTSRCHPLGLQEGPLFPKIKIATLLEQNRGLLMGKRWGRWQAAWVMSNGPRLPGTVSDGLEATTSVPAAPNSVWDAHHPTLPDGQRHPGNAGMGSTYK